MKKLLVVLLVVAMVFGLATSALAYTDTKALNQTQQDAIAKLTALDVVGGYPDGTFGPENSITRAEFAKIACNLAGVGGAADNLAGTPSRFSDVATGAWYTGWINLATSQGFVNGYPDGTFKPNNNITMQEVVTVLLRIAGYDDNLPGPWPFDYIAQASKLGVTDDVTFLATAKATRGDVAVMGSNILDQDVVFWNSDKARFEDINAPSKTSVLADSFGAVVDEDELLGDWDVDDFEDMVIKVGTFTLADSYYISGGFFVNDLEDMIGDVYKNSKGKVIYIDVTSSVKYSDDVNVNTAGTPPVTTVKVDGKAVKLAAAPTLPADNDYVAKVFYNSDNEVYLVTDISGATKTGLTVVDKYNDTAKRVEVLLGSTLNVKSKDVVVIKDGAFATLADLERGDVFYKNSNSNGVDEVIAVFAMEEGLLTKGTATKLTIDGKGLLWAAAEYTDDDFDSTASVTLGALDDAFGDTVKYVTFNGNPFKLAFLSFGATEDTTTRVYGIVTGAKGDIGGNVTSITLFNQEGKEVDYPIVKGDAARPVWGDGGIGYGSYIEAKVSEDGSIDTDNFVKKGNLADNDKPAASDYTALASSGSYVASSAGTAVSVLGSRLLIGGVYYTVTDNTIAFNVALSGGAYDEATLIKPADLKAASSIANAAVAAKVSDGNVVSLVFLSSDLTSSSSYGVLTGVQYRGGNWYVSLVGGEEYKAAADYSAIDNEYFIKYKIADGKLTHEVINIAGPSTTNSIFTFNHTAATVGGAATAAEAFSGNAYVLANGTYSAAAAPVAAAIDLVAKNGNTLTLGTDGGSTKNYIVNDNTVYYLINSDDEIVEADSSYAYSGLNVFAVTTDDPGDYIIEYLFIFE